MNNNSGTVQNLPSAVPLLANEKERIAALNSYHILDTAEEKDFDDLTTLASVICQTPVALISLVDQNRQWFKSHIGTSITETVKEYSFCAHAIGSPSPIMIVGDATKDTRFANNPFVTGEPHLAFYAGVTLVNNEGFALGSLCVFDNKVRELSNEQINALMVIAKQVVDKLELRRKLIQLEAVNKNLSESENRFRNLIDQAPMAIAIYTGPKMIIEQANEAMLNLLGQTKDIIGQQLLQVRPELKGHPYVDVLRSVFKSGKEHRGFAVKAPIRHNGQIKEGYFDATYKALINDKGEILGVIVLATDVSEKIESRQRENKLQKDMVATNKELKVANKDLKQSQKHLLIVNESLIESESRFRDLIEQAPVAIASLRGREFTVHSVNEMVLQIWGKDHSVIGKPLHIAIPELKGQPFFKILDNVYTTGKPYYGNEVKVTLKRKGELVDCIVNFVYQPIKGKNKTTRDIMVVATDVTDQVEARKSAEELNHRLQIALNASELGSTEVDLATGAMYSTEQFKKNYGRTKDEVFNYPDLFNAMLPEYREHIKNLVQTAIQNNSVYQAEYQVKWPDGSIHWISAHGKPRYDDEGKANRMVGMTEDITAEVNARKQLEEAEEKFRMIADNISQLAWMADETGSIFWYNKRWYDYTATTLDEMKGWGWQKVHHPDHLERVVKKVTRHFETGEIWEDVFPLKSKDGEYRWFLSRAIPTKNKQGQVISWFGTNTDITEQRKQEERKDDFLSIASHELKTPITSLKAGLQLLNVIKEKPNSPMHIKLIEQCNRSMDRMGALIDDLLNVNRMATGQLQLYITTFTIADLLRTSCTDVRIAAKHKLIVQGEKNLIVAADEHRIEQVVVNFVNNAVKYAPGSEEIFLIVEKIGDHAKISVKDSGPGIAKEKLSFLFDRYYRVDHSGQTYTGLGLGLYISAEIIKRHGGQIGVESELGKGSAFWFTLPL